MLLAVWEVANGKPQADVVRERPVSQAALSRAVRRETYRDLPEPEALEGVPFEQALELALTGPPRAVYLADVERVLYDVLSLADARQISSRLNDLPDPRQEES